MTICFYRKSSDAAVSTFWWQSLFGRAGYFRPRVLDECWQSLGQFGGWQRLAGGRNLPQLQVNKDHPDWCCFTHRRSSFIRDKFQGFFFFKVWTQQQILVKNKNWFWLEKFSKQNSVKIWHKDENIFSNQRPCFCN